MIVSLHWLWNLTGQPPISGTAIPPSYIGHNVSTYDPFSRNLWNGKLPKTRESQNQLLLFIFPF